LGTRSTQRLTDPKRGHRRDGIPGQHQALTAVRGVAGKIAGSATAVAGKVATPFERKTNDEASGTAGASHLRDVAEV